jgi:hypothetical protein
MKIRLVVEISASRQKDAHRLAAVIGDYADEQLKVMTDRGRVMTLRSWIWKPNQYSDDFVLKYPRY